MMLGSPPRMRGKDRKTVIILSLVRITPAHAGKSKSADKSRRRKRDHPRACGEKRCHLVPPVLYLGSPPRMRGKDFTVVHDTSLLGITPAHAGKSFAVRCVPLGFQDHPRACGEK